MIFNPARGLSVPLPSLPSKTIYRDEARRNIHIALGNLLRYYIPSGRNLTFLLLFLVLSRYHDARSKCHSRELRCAWAFLLVLLPVRSEARKGSFHSHCWSFITRKQVIVAFRPLYLVGHTELHPGIGISG